MSEPITMPSRFKRWLRSRSTICGCILFVILLTVFLLYTCSETHVPSLITPLPTITLPVLSTTTANPRPPTSLLKPEDHFVVPNIAHYVWFGRYEPMRFHHFLSIKSTYLHMKPERIFFHCDNEPTGKWWREIKNIVKTLRIRHRKPPTEIFGNEVIKPEHQSDIARMQILMEEGGIYIDTDVLVIRSFDPLRRYNFTMGLEYHGHPGRLNNGVIISTKDARFLKIWYNSYTNFTKREWDFHDSIIPYLLQYVYPQLLHVEEGTINYPSGKQLGLIYNALYDWRRNYAMHLWYRLHEFDHTPNDIRKMNTTFGELARWIYYGSEKML